MSPVSPANMHKGWIWCHQTTSNIESKAIYITLHLHVQWTDFLNHWVSFAFIVWEVSLILFLRSKCLASHLKIQKLLLLVPTALTLAHSDYTITRRLFPEEPCLGGLAGLEMVSPKQGEGRKEKEGEWHPPPLGGWMEATRPARPWWIMKPEAWGHPYTRGGHNWVCTSL